MRRRLNEAETTCGLNIEQSMRLVIWVSWTNTPDGESPSLRSLLHEDNSHNPHIINR